MDPRQSLSRQHPSNVQQEPFHNGVTTTFNSPYQAHQAHLPPIHPSLPHQQQQISPPTGRGIYHPSSAYQPHMPRSNDSPMGNWSAHLPSRLQPAPQFSSQGGPSLHMSVPLLPQPNHQIPLPQTFPPASTTSQGFQPRIAPAPIRNDYALSPPPFSQPESRAPIWSNPQLPTNGVADSSRELPPTHVVGSQGRRGILPSAPGRPVVQINGGNGSPKNTIIPGKDADGKFPCPNCNKTYLHAKHLKRHLLRHTGDRPYMCVLCKDTFSRSDILKRHFQKCSVRRGNPTGASHLSNPAAHLKKAQVAAKNVAKGKVKSPIIKGGNHPSATNGASLPQNARNNSSMSSSSSNFGMEHPSYMGGNMDLDYQFLGFKPVRKGEGEMEWSGLA